jgi:hypothetical protein
MESADQLFQRQIVADSHLRWMWGWEREPTDGHWDFWAVQGEFYDRDDQDVLLYDDADTEHRVARSAEEYRSTWEPVFNRLVAAEHRLTHVCRGTSPRRG